MLKQAFKQLCPPLLWSGLKKAFGPREDETPAPQPPEYEFMPRGWETELPRPQGWNVPEVAEMARIACAANREAFRQRRPFRLNGQMPGYSLYEHNVAMTLGYVLGRAAQGRQELSILDWGGSVGGFYPLARALHPELEFDFHCRDLPEQVEMGKSLHPEVKFHADDSCLERRYDFVMANNSFFYLKNWREMLSRLRAATAGYLYLSHLPLLEKAKPYVFLQRAYRYGYNTEYLGWAFNRAEFFAETEKVGLRVEREFFYSTGYDVVSSPENPVLLGALFQA